MPAALASFLAICIATSHGCSKPQLVTSLPEYHRQSRAAVEAVLGAPTTTDAFPMSRAVGEFRVSLLNTYPTTDPANANVMIEESWWQDGDYWITLWFHQIDGSWVVLDSCWWHKDVVF